MQNETVKPTSTDEREVAIVCEKNGPEADRMRAYLQSNGWSGRWYATRDLDDVDALAGAGKLDRVIFTSWQDLLEGIWTGEVAYGNWLAAGVQVSFLNPPAGGTAESLAAVSQTWDAYRAKRSRSNAVAGLVLSLIVVLAAFAIIQICR